MMILRIGKFLTYWPITNKKRKAGLSFIELMMAAAVLSSGIVFVFKAFFMSMTTFDHLTNRLYALTLASSQVVSLQQNFRVSQDAAAILGKKTQTIMLGNRPVNFTMTSAAVAKGESDELYEVEVLAEWNEGSRDFKISQSAYLGGF